MAVSPPKLICSPVPPEQQASLASTERDTSFASTERDTSFASTDSGGEFDDPGVERTAAAVVDIVNIRLHRWGTRTGLRLALFILFWQLLAAGSVFWYKRYYLVSFDEHLADIARVQQLLVGRPKGIGICETRTTSNSLVPSFGKLAQPVWLGELTFERGVLACTGQSLVRELDTHQGQNGMMDLYSLWKPLDGPMCGVSEVDAQRYVNHFLEIRSYCNGSRWAVFDDSDISVSPLRACAEFQTASACPVSYCTWEGVRCEDKTNDHTRRCIWEKTHKSRNETVLCEDGTYVTDWNCKANKHGQRTQCPPDMPVMCALTTCGGGEGEDHCCDTTEQNCTNYGGPRPCNLTYEERTGGWCTWPLRSASDCNFAATALGEIGKKATPGYPADPPYCSLRHARTNLHFNSKGIGTDICDENKICLCAPRPTCWEEEHVGFCLNDDCDAPPGRQQADTIWHCQRMCARATSCRFFAYEAATHTCWLKTQKGTFKGGAAVQVGPATCPVTLYNISWSQHFLRWLAELKQNSSIPGRSFPCRLGGQGWGCDRYHCFGKQRPLCPDSVFGKCDPAEPTISVKEAIRQPTLECAMDAAALLAYCEMAATALVITAYLLCKQGFRWFGSSEIRSHVMHTVFDSETNFHRQMMRRESRAGRRL